MNVVVIGLSHHSSPVELRERFAFAEAKIPDALKSLRESGIADEAVILSTCNRVEIYAATALEPAKAFAGLKKFLALWGKMAGKLESISPSPQRGGGRGEGVQFGGDQLYSFAEPQSLHHLFKVACGLDSMVLGETEILGQLKQAYALAHQPRPHRRAAEQGLSARLQRRQTRPHRDEHPAWQRVRGVGCGRTCGENFQFAQRARSDGHWRR